MENTGYGLFILQNKNRVSDRDAGYEERVEAYGVDQLGNDSLRLVSGSTTEDLRVKKRVVLFFQRGLFNRVRRSPPGGGADHIEGDPTLG